MTTTTTMLRPRPADDARLIDVIRQAARAGLTLVTNGADVYLTPQVMPGEFRVGVSSRGGGQDLLQEAA
jgi:hypothetical protein